MLTEQLGDLGSAADVLRRVDAGARACGLPPSAALIGDWFGSRAIIAPTVEVAPVDPADVFDVRPGEGDGAVGGGWIGYLSYPDPGADGTPPRIPEAAGGWTDCVLRLDRDGTWWYESLSGAALPGWLESALATRPPEDHCVIDWRMPDAAEHRAGVLSCLEAIRAGEVYQACVCTQFTGTATGSPLHFFAEAVTRTTPGRASIRCAQASTCV